MFTGTDVLTKFSKMAVFDRILFKFAHLILWLYTLVERTWFSWVKKLPVQVQPGHRKNTFRKCQEERTNIQKFPYHLSLVFLEERLSFQDVANIVVWCAAVGISYLSVFDNEGVMKMHTQELIYHITEKQKELLEREGSKVFVETDSSPGSHTQLNNHNSIDAHQLNGNAKQSTIRLHILGPEDGQPYLVRAAQQYCSEGSIRHNPKGADDEDFDLGQIVQESYSFPDPDLIIKFGAVSSLLGFLPWQIRLTEIISYPSHHGFGYKSFLGVLHTYARTEQRFGK